MNFDKYISSKSLICHRE
uniref:Uncharacterized protein n=1 Tax=Rhizophora mucronata TaxID=61149 RepID=A0A2P2Q4E8_RHIMU